MVLHHPGDPETAAVQDQFLYGRDLLVAPVVEEGATARQVHGPGGGGWGGGWGVRGTRGAGPGPGRRDMAGWLGRAGRRGWLARHQRSDRPTAPLHARRIGP